MFAHTKFGSVQMKGSGVKRGAGGPLSLPERVFENPGMDRVNLFFVWRLSMQDLD